MIDPFDFAKLTSCSSCALEAAWPVGLFGEQKKIKSVRGVAERSGKKRFSGLHLMYSIPPYPPVSFLKDVDWPIITPEST